jgi:hypothetical protein
MTAMVVAGFVQAQVPPFQVGEMRVARPATEALLVAALGLVMAASQRAGGGEGGRAHSGGVEGEVSAVACGAAGLDEVRGEVHSPLPSPSPAPPHFASS